MRMSTKMSFHDNHLCRVVGSFTMGAVMGIPSQFLAPKDEFRHPIPYCKMCPIVYLRIVDDGGVELGEMHIKLSRRTHPLLTDNFIRLCTGAVSERVTGKPLTLAGSSLWSDGMIVGGGEVGDSFGRAANQSGILAQTSQTLPQSSTRFTLAMMPLSVDRKLFTSLFYFVRPAKSFELIPDGVIFGDVIYGEEVLDAVHCAVESHKKVSIESCGLL